MVRVTLTIDVPPAALERLLQAADASSDTRTARKVPASEAEGSAPSAQEQKRTGSVEWKIDEMIKDLRLALEDAGLSSVVDVMRSVDDNVKAVPQGYLGSDKFKSLAQICKNRGGTYISNGKNSHYQIEIEGAE